MVKKENKSPFELLRNKSILSILDGDTQFELSDKTQSSMPYLSGPTIVEISQKFGKVASYSWNGGAQSRWAYLDDLIVHCIQNNRISDLLGYLFSKEQFKEKLKDKKPNEIEEKYNLIISATLEQINGILYFGGNKLIISNSKFLITELFSVVEVEAPTVKNIDRDYIKNISDRALQDIIDGNYDSAITKARTLLEEVFCYVIERKEETPFAYGDIGKLYKQVKELYNMHSDKDIDKRVNMLLSGLEKIVSSIAEMRNANSDAHGVGKRRIKISENHARLFVNSAMIMAEFIISLEKK